MAGFYDTWRSGSTGIGPYTLTPRTVGEIPLNIDLLAGQTAVGLRVRNSAGTVLFSIEPDGDINISGNINAVVSETLTGNISLTGNLTVDGNTILGNALTDTVTINGVTTMAGALTVTGAGLFLGNLTVNNALTVSGEATLSGRVIMGGAVNFPDGTAALPSITFTLDTDTGIYRPAANQIGFSVNGVAELILTANEISPNVASGLALGSLALPFGALNLDTGSRIIWSSGVGFFVFQPAGNDFTFTGAALYTWDALFRWTAGVAITAAQYEIGRDADGTNQLHFNVPTGATFEFSVNDVAQTLGVLGGWRFSTGAAVTAAQYEVVRDADGTNQLHFNVPTGATFEWSVNDVAEATLSATAVNFQNNSITTTGGGSLTGTWTDLGTVTTVDINGGTLDGVTIGGTTAAAATVSVFTVNRTAVGIGIDLNLSATTYTTATGGIDVVRSGALTGVATENLSDLQILPAFTLTEPGAGSFSYYGANIDMTSVAVTAGAGTTVLSALRLVSGADADAGNNYALFVDAGQVRFDGGGTSAQASAAGGVLEIQASTVVGNNASSTIAIGAAMSLGITTFQNGTATLTMTDVASFYIAGVPVASTNVAFTNTALALWIDAGLSRFDGGIVFAATGQSTLNNYTENTFTPTVTLVGGAGNTVPVYTTNTGRYTRVGNRTYVDIYLTGDGGAEGAGTGTVNIALPVTAGASNPAGQIMAGTALNGTASYVITGEITGGATTIALSYFNAIGTEVVFTGADQNNITRTIRLQFFYEV